VTPGPQPLKSHGPCMVCGAEIFSRKAKRVICDQVACFREYRRLSAVKTREPAARATRKQVPTQRSIEMAGKTPAEKLAEELSRSGRSGSRGKPKQWECKLAQFRGQLRLTQIDVAEYLGITLAKYHRVESGQADPSLSLVSRACDFYGVDWKEIWSPIAEPSEPGEQSETIAD
jgi:DNA-binding XRE family transcriptional regulator